MDRRSFLTFVGGLGATLGVDAVGAMPVDRTPAVAAAWPGVEPDGAMPHGNAYRIWRRRDLRGRYHWRSLR